MGIDREGENDRLTVGYEFHIGPNVMIELSSWCGTCKASPFQDAGPFSGDVGINDLFQVIRDHEEFHRTMDSIATAE
jgi:hypothetical protein